MRTKSSLPWELSREIPSDTLVGSELREPLLAAMRSFGWGDDEGFRVQLAYEEAIVNSIRHGNRCDPAKSVAVQMYCDHREVRIAICDQGAGFDVSDVPDPRDECLLEVPGGRGVLLIRELMSEVRYEDEGRRIIMVKRVGEPPVTSQATDSGSL